MKPTKTMKLESFGGVRPAPYRGGGTQVVRGFIQIKTTSVYALRTGSSREAIRHRHFR